MICPWAGHQFTSPEIWPLNKAEVLLVRRKRENKFWVEQQTVCYPRSALITVFSYLLGQIVHSEKSEWTCGPAPYFSTKLEQVAIYFSRGYSWPRDWTHVLCNAGRFPTAEPPGKPHSPLSWVNLSGVMKNGVCCVFLFFISRVFLALEMAPQAPKKGFISCKVFLFSFFSFKTS